MAAHCKESSCKKKQTWKLYYEEHFSTVEHLLLMVLCSYVGSKILYLECSRSEAVVLSAHMCAKQKCIYRSLLTMFFDQTVVFRCLAFLFFLFLFLYLLICPLTNPGKAGWPALLFTNCLKTSYGLQVQNVS